jgi:putative proteasome-type protease
MMTTAAANLSVGPPYDIGVYRPGTHQLEELRVEEHSPFLARLQELWHRHQLAAIAELPVLTRDSVTSSGAAALTPE